MRYDLIDEQATGDNVIASDAKNSIARATLLEYEARRIELLQGDNPASADQINDAWIDQEDAQAEADAFAQAAQLSPDEIGRQQRSVLREQIVSLEAQYVGVARRLEVRRRAGLPGADNTNQLDELEKCKNMALEMLSEKGTNIEQLKAEASEEGAPNRAERRTAKRMSQKAAKKTSKSAKGS